MNNPKPGNEHTFSFDAAGANWFTFDVPLKLAFKKRGFRAGCQSVQGLAVSWVFCSYLYFVKASILA